MDNSLISLIVSIVSIAGSVGSILGVIFAICTYKKTAKENQKTQIENFEQERIRATLRDFPQLKRSQDSLELNLRKLKGNRRTCYLRTYLGQLEQFAVGINLDVYSLDVVDRMSGGKLIKEYKDVFKDFIYERRYNTMHPVISPERMYCEYETMIRKLFEKRGLEWED